MIKEAYCSEGVYKLLREKGFEGEIHTFYDKDGYTVPVITHQMAMAWLREVHNICIVIEPHAYDCINEKNSSYVYSLWEGDNYYENPELKSYPSYEEAVEAALKYVSENLI